jgi:hypothetical protein
MEFGLFLATIDLDAVRESARIAEELGYHLLGKLCTGLNGAAICDSCEHFQQGKATGR